MPSVSISTAIVPPTHAQFPFGVTLLPAWYCAMWEVRVIKPWRACKEKRVHTGPVCHASGQP